MDMQGNLIYAVDFDKTISMAKWPEVGEPNIEVIELLLKKKAAGCRLILNTCRTGKPLEDALKFCNEYGLRFDAVNENLPELIEAYKEDARKISADYYLDDKAITPEMFIANEQND